MSGDERIRTTKRGSPEPIARVLARSTSRFRPTRHALYERINRHDTRDLNVRQERPAGGLRNDAAAKALRCWARAEREAWLDAVTTGPWLPGRLLPKVHLGRLARRTRVEVRPAAARQLRTFKPEKTGARRV